METPEKEYKIKDNPGYLFANMETLKASDEEAFKDSLTENFLDGIESWWCGIPGTEKKNKRIWNLTYEKKITALEAWAEAETHYQLTDQEKYPQMYHNLDQLARKKLEESAGMKKRKLALRKKSIIVDTLNAMGFLLTKWEKSQFEEGDDEKEEWAEGGKDGE